MNDHLKAHRDFQQVMDDFMNDFLLEEFAGELALIAPIPPGIVEADFDPKGDIRFIENLIPEYDSFHLDSDPDSGDFTMDMVEDIFNNPIREPRVHVPNVLPTHPTLHLDSDFTLSSDPPSIPTL
ncbi:hypothetical protein Tco_0144973 [Tanacetum coccineum]